MTDSPLVLVTGASGYVAMHVVQQLLREGYRVRGTVRSLTNQKKLKPIWDMCPDNSRDRLELVETDLNKDEGWSEAVKGCDYVLHVASPFPSEAPKDENELIKPAVEGTKRVLTACAQEVLRNRKLKRVVLTSSIAAVHGETTEDQELYTEKDWSDVDSKRMDAYPRSKTLAEKAAWQLVKNLPENQRFELAVVNPGFVFGPVLSAEAASSVDIISRMMSKYTMPLIPKINLCICDVRDVAIAHIKAMIVPEAAGNRHLVVAGHRWMTEVAQTLRDEFSKLGYAIPQWGTPYIGMWFYSFVDKPTRLLLDRYGKNFNFDDQRMRQVLGIEPRAPEITVIDTIHSMIQKGMIEKTKQYEAPPQK